MSHNSSNHYHPAYTHGNHMHPNDFAKDFVFALENWKVFPVANTEVLMDSFPLLLPPVDHFKEVIRRMKNEEDKSCYYNSGDTEEHAFHSSPDCEEENTSHCEETTENHHAHHHAHEETHTYANCDDDASSHHDSSTEEHCHSFSLDPSAPAWEESEWDSD